MFFCFVQIIVLSSGVRGCPRFQAGGKQTGEGSGPACSVGEKVFAVS